MNEVEILKQKAPKIFHSFRDESGTIRDLIIEGVNVFGQNFYDEISADRNKQIHPLLFRKIEIRE